MYEEWLGRKLAREPFRPEREWVVSKEWYRITGGREMFGRVTIRVAPSDGFGFDDACTWPDDDHAKDFTNAVLDGILDCLLIDVCASPGKAQFRLEAIEWRADSSVPWAYYRAAREAIAEAFGLNEKARIGMVGDAV